MKELLLLEVGLTPSAEKAAMLVNLTGRDDSFDLALGLFTVRGRLGMPELQVSDGQAPLSGQRGAVDLSNEHAYVFSSDGMLRVIDISDVAQPNEVGTLQVP